MNLYVEQQFNSSNDNKKKKFKRQEILVFGQSPFCIKFFSEGSTIIFKVSESETVKEVFERFTSQNKLNLENVFFLYNGRTITLDDFDKKIVEIANKTDIEGKVMSIQVNVLSDSIKSEKSLNMNEDNNFVTPINSLNSLDEFPKDNELEQNLPVKKIETLAPVDYSQKWFYIKIFLF